MRGARNMDDGERGGDGAPRRNLRGARRQPGRGVRFFGEIPPVIVTLAAVFAGIFAFMQAAPDQLETTISAWCGFSPERLAAGPSGPGGWLGALGPLVTHAFIHATAPHLLFNLLWFVVFGTPVARRFTSALRFISFFLACAAAGALFFSIFHRTDDTLLIGASGGISGLLGGMVRFAFHRPDSKPTSVNGLLPLADKSVLTWAAVVILLNLSIVFFGGGPGAGDAEIAWEAHIGGFLFGLVFLPLFDPKRRAW